MATGAVNVGQVIWISFKPIAKMLVVAGGGALCARLGILTPEASKANSALILKLFLPLLIFATVVPSFGRENIGQVGMILVTGFLYQAIGLAIGGLVQILCPRPKTWKGGVWASGIMSNWGDLVIAYTATLSKSAPFNGEKDGALGTAYSSIFVVSQLIVLFNFGAHKLVQMDFQEKPTCTEDGHGRQATLEQGKNRSSGIMDSTRRAFGLRASTSETPEPVNPFEMDTKAVQPCSSASSISRLPLPSGNYGHSRGSSVTFSVAPPTPRNVDLDDACTIAPTPYRNSLDSSFTTMTPKCQTPPPRDHQIQPFEFDPNNDPEVKPLYKRVWGWLEPFMSPPSISLIISLIVANVPSLKALFILDPKGSIGMAPDNKPPLDIILEIAKFCEPVVPILGLTLLGAAMSRLTIKSLPKGFFATILSMSSGKMIISPIIGIVWTRFLVRVTPFISESDKMLQLVMIVSAGVPTATTIIYMTTMYAPVGGDDVELSALSAMMLGQYCMMLFTLTALVTYTLIEVL